MRTTSPCSGLLPLVCALLILAVMPNANAGPQDEGKRSVDFRPGVQLRPRFEGYTFNPDHRVNQRTRLWFVLEHARTRAKVTIQDVRQWGLEDNTLKDFHAEGVDFHEGWLQLGDKDISLRLGRQELALDGQRLIGAVNWSQQGRSFDGLRLNASPWGGRTTVLLSRVPDGDRHDLFLLHTAWQVDGARLAFPLIAQSNRAVKSSLRKNNSRWDRFTGGVHAKSTSSALSWRLEAYAQRGTDHFAYMAGVRLGYRFGPSLEPTLWLDYLSGDSDHGDDKTGTFDTLFATNHKFYGYFDKFLALPKHTSAGGLVDVAIKNKGKLGPGVLEVATHLFMRATEGNDKSKGAIAAEFDVVYAYQATEHSKLVAGIAAWLPQGSFADNEATRALDTWAFVMLDVTLSKEPEPTASRRPDADVNSTPPGPAAPDVAGLDVTRDRSGDEPQSEPAGDTDAVATEVKRSRNP